MSVAGDSRQFDTVITEQLANDRIAWTSTAGEDGTCPVGLANRAVA
ncbi:hypothetical protein IWX88_002458 [Frigoribacterium sp. CG_9.8]|nr:hypothetical protein [Frigoribacterium sp. CG_9.8]